MRLIPQNAIQLTFGGAPVFGRAALPYFSPAFYSAFPPEMKRGQHHVISTERSERRNLWKVAARAGTAADKNAEKNLLLHKKEVLLFRFILFRFTRLKKVVVTAL